MEGKREKRRRWLELLAYRQFFFFFFFFLGLLFPLFRPCERIWIQFGCLGGQLLDSVMTVTNGEAHGVFLSPIGLINSLAGNFELNSLDWTVTGENELIIRAVRGALFVGAE